MWESVSRFKYVTTVLIVGFYGCYMTQVKIEDWILLHFLKKIWCFSLLYDN